MDLFDRIVKVTVAAQPTGFVGANPQFFETIGNAIEINNGQRIEFDVTKHLGSEPNKCEIKLYNLSADTRSLLDRRPLQVTLLAGYADTPRLLFIGDMSGPPSTRREVADVVTTIRVADGMRAYAYARMNRSYKPPIRVATVLGDAARSLGLTLPPEVEQSIELRQALEGGISTHGPTRDILTRLLAPYGFGWSIQNGRLQILRDEQRSAGDAFLVNLASGLIGEPEKTAPEKPGDKTEIKFETQMWPELVPGALVTLQSKYLPNDATCKLFDVQAKGDNRDGDFKMSLTARPT